MNASTQSAMAAVTPVAVSIQPKIDAAATMNMTVAVVSTVSRQTFTNIRHDSVRYQNRPSTIAHTQAAMAPSVGVKSPVVMPPIKSTGVMIGSTAWNLNFQSARKITTGRDDRCLRRGAHCTRRVQRQRPRGYDGCLDQCATKRDQTNLMSPPQPFLWARSTPP